jgi:hypothetical protein
LLGEKANSLRTHYFFIKKVEKEKGESEEEYKKRVKRQDLKIKDLNRYGIKALEVDSYDEITAILKSLENFYKRSNVFMSGSVEFFEENNKENDNKHKLFVHNLTKKLLENKFKIITGKGKVIGDITIDATLDYMFSNGYQRIDEYIKMRPFPSEFTREGKSEEDRKEIKKDRNKKYRDEMLKEAGVAVFIYGNKKVEGITKLSNGMEEEFDIAIEKGMIPIPIGATGHMAKKLWDKVINDFDVYYPSNNDNKKTMDEIKKLILEIGDEQEFRKQINNELGNKYFEEIYNNVIEIIKKLNAVDSL